MENPKTPLEKADAVANLVEQMAMSHRIGDRKHFEKVHQQASRLLFELVEQLNKVDYSRPIIVQGPPGSGDL